MVPSLAGVIDRRLLVNFAVEPDVAAEFLPAPFEPQLVAGRAVAGVCLIRLAKLRPHGLPGWIGLRSENAAHRFAVVRTDEPDSSGVFIPRRDSSSRITTWVGGRLFPGAHHRADFTVASTAVSEKVAYRSRDRRVSVEVTGSVGRTLPAGSVFDSLEMSSTFFANGCRGWSATGDPVRFDGLELRTAEWKVEPFDVDLVRSSFFDDTTVFPAGSVRFDHALIMRGIAHTWHPIETVDAGPQLAAAR